MSVPIHSGLTDDNDFVRLVQVVIDSLLSGFCPEQVWVIQIDNWFDHKWLGYSGNGGIANWRFAGNWSPGVFLDRFDSVKTEFFRDKTTFPPFSPDRVLGQWSYSKSGDRYVESPLRRVPHGAEKIRSETNLNRRIEASTKDACFIWYSGNTLKNRRGSLMVYIVRVSHVDCWFAAFERNQDWSLSQTKGISRAEVLRMLSRAEAGQ